MKVALTPHQEKFIASKMKSGGSLKAALRHSLRSPLKMFRPGHFASLAKQDDFPGVLRGNEE